MLLTYQFRQYKLILNIYQLGITAFRDFLFNHLWFCVV